MLYPYTLNLENEKSVKKIKLQNGDMDENPEREAEEGLLFWDFFMSFILLGVKVYFYGLFSNWTLPTPNLPCI